MDHQYIEEQGLVAAYLRGTLEDPDRERFEAHFIDCPSCLEELEWEEHLAQGVKIANAVGMIERPRSGPVRWIRWLGNLEPAPRRALLAASLAAALLLPFFAGRYQGRSASSDPQVNTPLVYLSAVRDGEPSENLQRIYLPGRDEPGLLLVLEVGRDAAFEEYGIHIESLAGGFVWESSGLEPNPTGSLTLTLPPGFLKAGAYRLAVLGVSQGTEPAEMSSYAFQAIAPEG